MRLLRHYSDFQEVIFAWTQTTPPLAVRIAHGDLVTACRRNTPCTTRADTRAVNDSISI